MINLAIDTSDSRGSVAVRRNATTVVSRLHESTEDYSSWLLPAVDSVLRDASVGFRDLNFIAVATGPGSFTGVRVGLTVAKAWGEVYGVPLVGVSRLEGIARVAGSAVGGKNWIATSYDAHRGQIFAALYRVAGSRLALADREAVTAPAEFLKVVNDKAGTEGVRWLSLDPHLLSALQDWTSRAALHEHIEQCPPDLASFIGEIAEERFRDSLTTDSMHLDANYVRRSDAELFWKDVTRDVTRKDPGRP
jgi:tRNA threonylcarbamoyladenosine biosynthesis protein TsaB